MTEQVAGKKGVSLKQVLLIVAGAMVLTVVITFFAIKTWLFPSPFTPVELSRQEEQQLEQKLSRFDAVAAELLGNRGMVISHIDMIETVD
ncbi:MAG: hypothetical protein D3906_17300, partial [Candidatus Electrothrix sp. AUS1_2]|nr:hypothetical protein [Candidatus Electrothrix sp. AUS1_2]